MKQAFLKKIVWNSVFFKFVLSNTGPSGWGCRDSAEGRFHGTLEMSHTAHSQRITTHIRKIKALESPVLKKSVSWLNSVFPNPTDAWSHFFLLHTHEASGRSWNEKRKILGDVAKGNWGEADMLCSAQHVLTEQTLGLSTEVKYSWLIIPERQKKRQLKRWVY